MDSTIVKVQQRTRAYWFADGLNEILSGTFALILGVLILLKNHFQSTSLGEFFSITVNIFLLAGALSMPVLLRRAKEHITYPHSGYVAYKALTRSERVKQGLPVIMSFLLFVILIAISILVSVQTRLWAMAMIIWLPELMGIVAGVIFLRLAQQTGLLRQAVLSGVSFVTVVWLGWRSSPLLGLLSLKLTEGSGWGVMPAQVGAVMRVLMMSLYNDTAFLLIILGCAALISGVVGRLQYLKERHNVRSA